MPTDAAHHWILEPLNPEQRRAASADRRPLLIVAGAGTGKTATLVHRVAWLIAEGVDPARILLLTFTRRAAAEMQRRVDGILRRLAADHPDEAAKKSTPDDATSAQAAAARLRASRVWGGTFHAIATRLLRRFGKSIGLPPAFTIHDRTDSEDLMAVVRTELDLAKTDRRFPKKGTCMAIYSRCINAREKLDHALKHHFPWCDEWEAELGKLFSAYADRKEAGGLLDYDDLLLYWHALLADSKAGDRVRGLFDCVLVDEYQDTNVLQAEILHGLCPDGQGLTVVGDDAQSIYSFRAATVRNILDFPKQYADAQVVTLEQNYRSTQPILDATNQVIALARERFRKDLRTDRQEGERPRLVHCEDEEDQTEYVIRQILERREAGIDLRHQAVLFRASHHSMMLEAELAQRRIPFHKYGGLKFMETAHIKDLLALLRLAENPGDIVSGTRILPRLPGFGPVTARKLMQKLADAGGDFRVWRQFKAPSASVKTWPKLLELLEGLRASKEPLPAQVHRAREFYAPLLVEHYDNATPRLRDLEQLEQVASRYRSRRRMLEQLTLDPPASTQDLAGPPLLDDDYLVLSTIHSAKGLEWDAVYVIHAADGNIPSDMATRSPDEIEEERRLFYVALTRAKNWLAVCFPLRYYHYRPNVSDNYGMAQRTRFLPDGLLKLFEQEVTAPAAEGANEDSGANAQTTSRSIRAATKRLWS